MPSKSKKQRRFMAAAANNPDFARRAGIKQSVAKEFHAADKRKYQRGGLASMIRPHLTAGMPGGKPQPQPMGGQGMRMMPPTIPWMRRPPPQGGLATATKPMPMRIPGPVQPPGATTQPVMPRGIPGMTRMPGQMTPGERTPAQRGLTPGGGMPQMSRPLQAPPGGMRGFPGRFPGMGGLAQYGAARAASGAPSAPQRAPGGFSGFPGRGIGGMGPNAALRGSQAASQMYGNQLNRLMGGMRRPFAGGGGVRKKSNA